VGILRENWDKKRMNIDLNQQIKVKMSLRNYVMKDTVKEIMAQVQIRNIKKYRNGLIAVTGNRG
jgi:hypothetical protein